jgi:hypothetical protein
MSIARSEIRSAPDPEHVREVEPSALGCKECMKIGRVRPRLHRSAACGW